MSVEQTSNMLQLGNGWQQQGSAGPGERLPRRRRMPLCWAQEMDLATMAATSTSWQE